MFALINRWPRCSPASEIEKARGPGHLAAVIGYTEAIKSTLRTIICNPHVLPSSKRIICSSLHPRPRQRGSYQHRNPTPPYLMTIFRKHSLSQTISSFLSPFSLILTNSLDRKLFHRVIAQFNILFIFLFVLSGVRCLSDSISVPGNNRRGLAVEYLQWLYYPILCYRLASSSPRPAYHVTTHLQPGSRSIQPRRAPASLIIHNEE